MSATQRERVLRWIKYLAETTGEPVAVRNIATESGMKPNNISQHAQHLAHIGLIERTRSGFYRPMSIRETIAWAIEHDNWTGVKLIAPQIATKWAQENDAINDLKNQLLDLMRRSNNGAAQLVKANDIVRHIREAQRETA